MALHLHLLLLVLGAACTSANAPPPPCSLNGDLDSDGVCICDKPWSGPHCDKLLFRPVNFPQGYGMVPNQTSWGADVLYDSQSSKFHLWVSVISGACPLRNWTSHSRIEHAVADSITGPFSFQDVALPTFSTNPKSIRIPNTNLLALFHIGTATGPNQGPSCHHTTSSTSNFNVDRTAFSRRTLQQPSANGGSNIHFASSFDGPWTPLVNSTLPASCTNPSPFVHKQSYNNNSNSIPSAIYLVCKFGRNDTQLLVSDTIWGPWKTISKITPQYTTSSISPSTIFYEDPELYIDHRGIHVLFHLYNTHENKPNRPPATNCTHTAISAHLFSSNGKTWYQSPGQPYDNYIETTFKDDDNNNNNKSTVLVVVATRERPSVVIGTNPTTGQPQLTHLITATCSAPNCPQDAPPAGCVDCKYNSWDYTLIQPFDL